MLELKDVSIFIGRDEEVTPLLADVSATFPRGHFGAVIGPSGCGKSTLVKTIAGIAEGEEDGDVIWDGRDLEEDDFAPSEVGYVPQFSIAHEELTVRESVRGAIRLRVRGMRSGALAEAVDGVLEEVGLLEFADRRVAVLSGGQRRRLSLAMEIASKPAILLCDEVTSGLDPQSEDEIVRLLHNLSRSGDRLVLSVTHSLQHLDLYDSVMVLFEGVVAYHGPPEYLTHYFRVTDAAELYAQLSQRKGTEWAQSWKKHRTAFLEAMAGHPDQKLEKLDFESTATEPDEEEEKAKLEDEEPTPPGPPPSRRPGALSQFLTLFFRRVKIFFRNPAQLWLQLGLILGFPFLVAIFAWNGLPNIQNLSMGLDQDVLQQLVEAKDFLLQASKVGSLVSGIVMFQVILLTLMGANNSGREVAAERLIFEKEKLAGLRSSSYIASKVAFLSVLVAVQSLWMGLFVHYLCGLPGDLFAQLVFLLLVNGAMTAICLAISSWLGSAEQASLASIYLVGFQLPLSGAVLALPEIIGWITRPFIAAYWSWSGILQTLRGERYYDIVQTVIQTSLSPAALCMVILAFHIVIGIFLAWLGCQRSRLR